MIGHGVELQKGCNQTVVIPNSLYETRLQEIITVVFSVFKSLDMFC